MFKVTGLPKYIKNVKTLLSRRHFLRDQESSSTIVFIDFDMISGLHFAPHGRPKIQEFRIVLLCPESLLDRFDTTLGSILEPFLGLQAGLVIQRGRTIDFWTVFFEVSFKKVVASDCYVFV